MGWEDYAKMGALVLLFESLSLVEKSMAAESSESETTSESEEDPEESEEEQEKPKPPAPVSTFL